MKKKLAIIVILVLVMISAVIVLALPSEKEPETKEEALRQAREFVCDGTYLTVMTPAIHRKTGAELVFSSSCLPEGWEEKPPETIR